MTKFSTFDKNLQSAKMIASKMAYGEEISKNMDIRKTELHDIPVLAAMNKHLIEDEAHPNPMTVDELAERMRGWLSAGEYIGYLGLLDGTPVAYCVYRDNETHYYMRQLYVERDVRRRRLGTILLDWMSEHVWSGKPVRLDVLAHNERAIRFYESYGFVTGCLRMEKRL